MSLDTESQTTIPTQFRNSKKNDSLARRNYLPRTLGFTLLAILGWSQWWNERDVRTLHNLTLLLASLCSLVWPHIAWALASLSATTREAEYRNLYIDSFIGGSFICFQGFGLWQAQAILTVLCANNMSVGGGKLFLRGFAFLLLGVGAAFLLVGFRFEPYTGVWTALVSISFSFAYTVFTNYVSFRQARNLIKARQYSEEQSREILSQAAVLSEQATEIELANTALQQAHEESETLLFNILPAPIAHRLKSGERAIADRFDSVTVLFVDIVGFTKLSARITPEELVQGLNTIFKRFDELAKKYGLEKIKTIGDAYMVAGGLPERSVNHSERVARFALEIQTAMQSEELRTSRGEVVQLRIGIHTGSAVAGVIGTSKFSYDLWGDTVNTASRMESHGEAGKIHCSEEVYATLYEKFVFEERGFLEVKGKGQMKTYFLLSTL